MNQRGREIEDGEHCKVSLPSHSHYTASRESHRREPGNGDAALGDRSNFRIGVEPIWWGWTFLSFLPNELSFRGGRVAWYDS